MAEGDRREALVALRGVLADSIAEAKPEHRAPLVKQLRELLAELDGLAVPEVSRVDEIAAKRDARRATVPDGPRGDRKQRGS